MLLPILLLLPFFLQIETGVVILPPSPPKQPQILWLQMLRLRAINSGRDRAAFQDTTMTGDVADLMLPKAPLLLDAVWKRALIVRLSIGTPGMIHQKNLIKLMIKIIC
jgi:hypothetical protein